MIVLLDKSPAQLPQARTEIEKVEVGQLLTPLTRYSDAGCPYGIDNGAFKRFCRDDFLSLLERQKEARERCLFVAAPDVPFSARRTLELFDFWFPKLFGWPIALVAQDGQENLPIPWNQIQTIFIGGTDNFKLSSCAKEIIKCAKAMDIAVHVGRVNTPERFQWVDWLEGDSIDGTGISRYTHMRRNLTQGTPLLDSKGLIHDG